MALTFKLSGLFSSIAPMTVLTAMVAATPVEKLGPIGQAVVKPKKGSLPRIVGCPIRELNGVIEPRLLPTDDLDYEGLIEEGMRLNRDADPWEDHPDLGNGLRIGERCLAGWAKNAGGACAHLLTLAVQDVFGIEGDAIARFGYASDAFFHALLPYEAVATNAAIDAWLDASPSVVWSQARRYIARLYGYTQQELAGKSTVELYRGICGKAAQNYLSARESHQTLPARIVESWTTSKTTARKFATRNGSGIIVTMKVPVEDILCSYNWSKIVHDFESEWLVLSDGEYRPWLGDVETCGMYSKKDLSFSFMTKKEEWLQSVANKPKAAPLDLAPLEEGWDEDGQFYLSNSFVPLPDVPAYDDGVEPEDLADILFEEHWL